MQISYFEEFPVKENLSKLKLISSPTKLYLAAKSVKEFNSIKSKLTILTGKNPVKEIIYWPILDKNEGYWISPFSNRKALLRLFSELMNQKIPVMLDLELPTTQNPLLYITQSINFCRNKKLIRQFINNYSGKIYLAEYYPEGRRKEKIMESFGIHYCHPKLKIIKMIYHSMHYFNSEFLTNELKRGKEEYKNNYLVGLGTIARGIRGNEPILSVKQLRADLELCKKAGITECVIFRLGGLNKKYAELLNKIV